jgi:outer membrane biosynthesis protein TonB
MLRMVLLGLLIPCGVGMLAAMELRTPPRTLATVGQPVAETTVGTSDSHGALPKADRLDVTYARSETPTQPGPVDEPISPTEAAAVGPPEAPRIINRHRHDPKPKKVTTAALSKPKPKMAALAKSKPKTTNIKTTNIKTADIKRAAIPDRSKAAGDTETCRLSAFGGLRKALNLSGCEI